MCGACGCVSLSTRALARGDVSLSPALWVRGASPPRRPCGEWPRGARHCWLLPAAGRPRPPCPMAPPGGPGSPALVLPLGLSTVFCKVVSGTDRAVVLAQDVPGQRGQGPPGLQSCFGSEETGARGGAGTCGARLPRVDGVATSRAPAPSGLMVGSFPADTTGLAMPHAGPAAGDPAPSRGLGANVQTSPRYVLSRKRKIVGKIEYGISVSSESLRLCVLRGPCTSCSPGGLS